MVALTGGRADAETVVGIKADRIQFYNDRFLVEADGHVRVAADNGVTIDGDTLSMDLKLNRFLIAGNVRLRSRGGNIDGAAIADFLDFNRVYFVPVIDKPDRWTYADGDFTHPLKGREMPGDVFYFPDLSHDKLSLTAHTATVGSKNYVRFGDVVSYIFDRPVPMPSQYVYFGANPDLAQNSLAGANFDATYNLTGNNNSISAVHFRKDQTNGIYASYEQHLAWTRGYTVFSLNPATKSQHFWSLVATERIGTRFQLSSFSQLYEDTSHGFFRQPLAGSTWSYVTATEGLPQSFLSATGIFTNYQLVPTQSSIPNHPFSLRLSANTISHRVGKTPFFENIGYGLNVNHDALGLQTFGGYNYTTIWDHVLTGSIYATNIKLGNKENSYKTYYFNGSYTKVYDWFSVPHWQVNDTTNLTLSRQYGRAFSAYAGYAVAHTGDYYRIGGYTPPENPPVIDGVPVESILAFRGVSTLRTASLGATYTTNPNFVFNVVYQHHQDFPIPYPGLFPQPPTNNLGAPLYQNYLGQPPNNITGDVRFLALPHIALDISREYYFNFGTQRWAPTFTVQVIGQ